MGSEWTTKNLSDYLIRIIDNRGKTPPNSSDETSYELLEVNALKGKQCLPDYSVVRKYVSQEVYETWFRAGHPQIDDVLISTVGSIGEVALSEGRGSIAQNIIALCANPEVLDGKFLYYFLSSSKTKSALLSLDISSVQPSIKVPHLMELRLSAPAVTAQRKISSILSSLDNKIQLNRQTNQTLEQMAQALFKSWFVDFDPVIDNALAAGNPIPDELQDRAQRRQQQISKPDHKPLTDDIRQLFPSEFELTEELGWVPLGWTMKSFGDFLEQTIGGDWGKDAPDEKHTMEAVIVRGTDIPQLASGSQSSAPTRWVEPKKLKTRSLSDGDIVIEVSGGSPTQPTGRSIMMTKNLLERLGGTVEPASFCRKFRPLNREVALILGLHLQKIYVDGKTWEYQNTSTGISNFQTKIFLANEQVLIPDDNELIDEFYRTVRPIIDRMTSNDSIHLEKLRDILLPKLISGELRLPSEALADAEQQEADVIA